MFEVFYAKYRFLLFPGSVRTGSTAPCKDATWMRGRRTENIKAQENGCKL
jgi:hypothetical protein